MDRMDRVDNVQGTPNQNDTIGFVCLFFCCVFFFFFFLNFFFFFFFWGGGASHCSLSMGPRWSCYACELMH